MNLELILNFSSFNGLILFTRGLSVWELYRTYSFIQENMGFVVQLRLQYFLQSGDDDIRDDLRIDSR